MNNTKHSNCLFETLNEKFPSRGKIKIDQIGSHVYKRNVVSHMSTGCLVGARTMSSACRIFSTTVTTD